MYLIILNKAIIFDRFLSLTISKLSKNLSSIFRVGQKMLNPREKASTNFHLILSMESQIGYKKRVPLHSGLTKQIRIGKLDPKKTLVPAQVVFTPIPMSSVGRKA